MDKYKIDDSNDNGDYQAALKVAPQTVAMIAASTGLTKKQIQAAFPYLGRKSYIAPEVYQKFGDTSNVDKYKIERNEQNYCIVQDGLIITIHQYLPETFPANEGVDPYVIELVRLANVGIDAEYQRGYDDGYDAGLPL